jgi:hypothetical protein
MEERFAPYSQNGIMRTSRHSIAVKAEPRTSDFSETTEQMKCRGPVWAKLDSALQGRDDFASSPLGKHFPVEKLHKPVQKIFFQPFAVPNGTEISVPSRKQPSTGSKQINLTVLRSSPRFRRWQKV